MKPSSTRIGKPIPVMFVVSALDRGGQEGRLVEVLNNLDRRLFQPLLCVLHGGVLIPEIKPDVPVVANVYAWSGDIRGLFRLMRLMRAQQPAIVFVVGRDDAAWWGRLAAKLTGVQVIVQSLHHGRFPAWRYHKMIAYHVLNRLLDPWTNAFVAVSQTQRAFLIESGLPRDRTIVIYNGINVDRFDPGGGARNSARQVLGLSPETPVAGMVANFALSQRWKRHDVLLQAMVKVQETIPTVRCLLIGDGGLRAELESMSQKLGLSKVVSFLGSRPDVPDLLPALDVFVLTSDERESFSNAIVEAMAAGKPVVASACGGPTELVIEDETGFLVPHGQPLALAERVTFLLSNPKQAREMGQAGRRRASQCFNVQQMVAARESLFIELLSKKNRDEGRDPNGQGSVVQDIMLQ